MSVGVCEFNCEYVLLRFYLRVTGYETAREEASATLEHLLETLDFRGTNHDRALWNNLTHGDSESEMDESEIKDKRSNL